ncbi:MAG: response regulator transcription factor [Chloroflexi bacterium]|nr:response regulator transcription factor [Chloroflexota bacterium]
MIRILLVSPTLTLRVGLRALLGDADDVTVIGEGSSLAEYELDAEEEADVLVWAAASFSRPDLEDLLDEASTPPALLLLLDDQTDIPGLEGLPLRAWGILSIEASEEELLAALRALHEGLIVGTPRLFAPLLARQPVASEAQDPLAEALTPRETEVLQLLSHGLANKQIARELDISEHTVKFHISSIYAKLWATNRAEAVRLGIQRGLVTL